MTDFASPKPSILCSDLSFWKDKPCYNDSLYFHKSEPLYTKTRHCATYDNEQTNETLFSCENKNDYFCPLSKQCIPKEWLCDGAIQCKKGDDEDFKICEKTFPNNIATITCIENNRPDDLGIMIKAIPCNGIQECKDGSDEKCDLPSITIWIILGEHYFKHHFFIKITYNQSYK